MGTLSLSPELIDAFTKNAEDSGIKDRFVESDIVISNSELYRKFHEHYPACPKVVFYIWMDKAFGFSNDKDSSGALGRKLKFQ